MTTVYQRLTRAGIAEHRARAFLAAGWVRVGGQLVIDPDAEVDELAPIVLCSPQEAPGRARAVSVRLPDQEAS